jgi:hypothetical protein
MNKQIKQILNDLYELDPALEKRERELTGIINKLIASRPDVKMDAAFKEQLRKTIMEKTKNKKQEDKIIVPGTDFRLNPIAGFLVLFLVVLFVGSFYLRDNKSQPDKTYTYDPKNTGVEQFASAEEFQAYLALSESYSSGYIRGGGAIAEDFAEIAVPRSTDSGGAT